MLRPTDDVLLVHTLYHPAQRACVLVNSEGGAMEISQQDLRPLLRLIDAADGEIPWTGIPGRRGTTTHGTGRGQGGCGPEHAKCPAQRQASRGVTVDPTAMPHPLSPMKLPPVVVRPHEGARAYFSFKEGFSMR